MIELGHILIPLMLIFSKMSVKSIGGKGIAPKAVSVGVVLVVLPAFSDRCPLFGPRCFLGTAVLALVSMMMMVGVCGGQEHVWH